MIEQKINLFQDRFRPKRQFLTAAQIALLMIIVILGMAGYSINLKTEMDQAISVSLTLKQQQQSVAQELAVANAKLTRLLAEGIFPLQPDNDMIDQIDHRQ